MSARFCRPAGCISAQAAGQPLIKSGAGSDPIITGCLRQRAKYRARVTPARRGRGNRQDIREDPEAPTPAECGAAMTWAQRLKRVFGIDIETCPACGGAVRIIACVENPDVIEKILTHLDTKATASEATRRPPCRVPPQRLLFD